MGIDTKKAQLKVLQIVREGATIQHKELVAANERIDKD